MNRAKLITIGLAMFVGSFGATAAAASWGPVTASYNGTVRVTSHGTLYNDRAVYARDDYNLNDPANDGNNVYQHDNYLFLAGNNSCDVYSVNSPEYTYSNTPVWLSAAAPLKASCNISNPAGAGTITIYPTVARDSVVVCVQMGFPIPDKCGSAVVSFNY